MGKGSSFSIENNYLPPGHGNDALQARKFWTDALTAGQCHTDIPAYKEFAPYAGSLTDCKKKCLEIMMSDCGYITYGAPTGTAPKICKLYDKTANCGAKENIIANPVGATFKISAQKKYRNGPVWIQCNNNWLAAAAGFGFALAVIGVLVTIASGGVAIAAVGAAGAYATSLAAAGAGLTLGGGVASAVGLVEGGLALVAEKYETKASYDGALDIASKLTTALKGYTKVPPGQIFHWPRDDRKDTIGGGAIKRKTLSWMQKCTVVYDDGLVQKANAFTHALNGEINAYNLKDTWARGSRRRIGSYTVRSLAGIDSNPAPMSWLTDPSSRRIVSVGGTVREANFAVTINRYLSQASGWDNGCTSTTPKCKQCLRCVLCIDEHARVGMDRECQACSASGCADCVEEIPCIMAETPRCLHSSFDAAKTTECWNVCADCVTPGAEVFGAVADAACARCAQCEVRLRTAAMCLMSGAKATAPFGQGARIQSAMERLQSTRAFDRYGRRMDPKEELEPLKEEALKEVAEPEQ